jgi:uncharacterized protein
MSDLGQSNPFTFSEPVAPADLMDRDREAKLLVERALGGHNSRLVAPRRYGKTSLLRRALADIEAQGLVGVYVNFFGVLTRSDVAARIESAYAEQLPRRLARWFEGIRRTLRAGVRAGGGPLPMSVELTAGDGAERGLLDWLALPRQLHAAKGVRTLIVFDEFQDVLLAGERIDAVIRSEIEHHAQAARYVFAGSHVGMMRELFASKRRAFYGQAGAVELGPLSPEDVAEYVAERFSGAGREIGDALGPLLDFCDGHPQRTMLLAHFVFERVVSGGQADASTFTQALDHVLDVEAGDELRTMWSALTAGQRRALTAIAENPGALYSHAVQARVGGTRGGSVTTALRSLIDAGEVTLDPTRATGHRVVDPLLAYWVRAGRPDG